MKTRLMAVLATMSMLLLGLVAAPTTAAEAGYDWQGEPAMISNFGLYRSGEFIYQDYIYDDHGANTDGINHTDAPLGVAVRPGDPTNPRTGSSGGQIRHAGDYFYAGDSSGNYANVADLIEFRVARTAEDVHYLLRMGALIEADDAVVGMCVNEDGRVETGIVEWPAGVNFSQALGCDHFLTVHGDGTLVTDAAGSTTPLVELGGATSADVDANTISVRVPTSVADPADGTWRYTVASGVWDGDSWAEVPALPSNPASSTMTGGSALTSEIFDVLANNDEPNSYWREERQADDLRVGDLAKHFVDVSFKRLAQDRDDADPQLTGVVDRIYVAEHPMEPNEGIRFTAVALGPRNYIYYGDYQPYAVVIPSTYYEQLETDSEMAFGFDQCLHPLNGNHHVEIYYEEVEAQRNYVAGVSGTTEHTGYYGFSEFEQRIDRQNVVYACGVGRGEGVGFTGGNGMVDSLEVEREVKSHYSIDEDRHSLHGISLGAIGTWYMSTLYPDKYSSIAPTIFTGSRGQMFNLYNVPSFFSIGTFDQFAQGVTSGDGQADDMEANGNEYLYYRHLARFHELSIGTEGLPFSDELFLKRDRVTNPARVRYIHDYDRYSDKMPGSGSVYWVSGIEERDSSARIDITSLGRADELPTDQVVFDGLYENTHEGYQARMRGLFRMTPEEFADAWDPAALQDGWREITLDTTHTELEVPSVANGFELVSTGLAAASLDLARMELDGLQPMSATIDVDGAVTLTLLGAFPTGVTATLDGAPVETNQTPQGLTVTVPGSGALQIG